MTALRNLFLTLALLLLALVPASAASRFGVCTVTCTWDGSSTAMWSTSSGGATGASVPGSGDTVTFDAATCVGGVTCTITVNTTVNISTLTVGACTASTTGCILDFSANNNNVTTPNISFSGTGTRTINMGSGTWTITSASSTVFDNFTTTNETLSGASASLVFSANTTSGRNIYGGGKTFGSLTVNNTSSAAINLGTSATFASLSSSVGQCFILNNGVTVTFSSAFTLVGTAAAPLCFMSSTTTGTNATISIASGTATIAWGVFQNMTFTGGATFTASNSLDVRGYNATTGITITPPSTGGGGGHIIGGGL